MKNNQLISTFNFTFNPGGTTLKNKLPDLAKGPFILTLQVESSFYLAEVYFNYACNWLYLVVKNQSGETIQQNTYIREWPVNLLLCKELNSYGLFYKPNTSTFEFYKLGKEWYNLLDTDYFSYTEYLKTNGLK